MTSPPHNPLILALDVPSAAEALGWVRRLGPQLGMVKVGMRLFYAEGPCFVRALVDEGIGVFLDLKLYDIPNTIAQACETLAPLGARFLTLHASGGPVMLARAAEALVESQTQPVAVTCLTSFDAPTLAATMPGLCANAPDVPTAWVSHLAGMAHTAGVTAVVASPHEIAALRAAFGPALTIITPGIRPAAPENTTPSADDQRRVMTPQAALTAGADYLVIGRPILTAADPEALVDQILADMASSAGSAQK